MSTLEMVLIAPALLGLIFAVIQFALWYYAGSVARTAATEAAQAGAVGGRSAAQIKANQIISGPGGNVVSRPAVRTSDDGQTVTVTVTGDAPSLLLGIHLTVNATSTAPVEAFQPQPLQATP